MATIDSGVMARPSGILCLFALLGTSQAQAFGHFDVDDAGTLDPGQCQVALWGGHVWRGPADDGLHVGSACGVGPVELGVDFDLDRAAAHGGADAGAGSSHAASLGPRAKWNFYGRGDGAVLAAALSTSVLFDPRSGGRTGGQLVLPISWNPRENLQFNLNLGYDWQPGTGERTGREGAQVAWTANDVLTLVAEHSRAGGEWTTRLGARLVATPTFNIDLSISRTAASGASADGVKFGVTKTFNP